MACSAEQRSAKQRSGEQRSGEQRSGGARFRLAGLVMAALALVGCAGDPAAPEPAPPLSAYVIGAGDRIKITVLEIENMTVETDVATDGSVDLPLVGSIRVAGRTTADVLTERLARDFIKDPKVNVEVAKYRPFYVLGQVNKPGSYPFEPELDIRKAAAIAGGFNRRADTDAAYLVREVDGQNDRRRVGLGTRVYPGDVIEIDRRLF